jgi:hypothetical protein
MIHITLPKAKNMRNRLEPKYYYRKIVYAVTNRSRLDRAELSRDGVMFTILFRHLDSEMILIVDNLSSVDNPRYRLMLYRLVPLIQNYCDALDFMKAVGEFMLCAIVVETIGALL